MGQPRCLYCGTSSGPVPSGLIWMPKDQTPAPPPAPAEPKVEGSFERPRPTPVSQVVDSLLFVMALPIVVPSLMMTFAQAKRWGRIPLAIMAFDALLLIGIAVSLNLNWGAGKPLAVTLLIPAALGSTIAAGALMARRAVARRLDDGIFLGYSNLVAMLLIGGGTALGIGGFGVAYGLSTTSGVYFPFWFGLSAGLGMVGFAVYLATQES